MHGHAPHPRTRSAWLQEREPGVPGVGCGAAAAWAGAVGVQVRVCMHVCMRVCVCACACACACVRVCVSMRGGHTCAT